MTNPSGPTRKEFLIAVTGLVMLPAIAAAERRPPKVLIVVAHPDDEYAFAATVYRITRELGGIADQVIITNGEAGYRYSALAESIYRVSLTREEDGRAHLPSIRKAETLRAGEILGIRQHHFLNQHDSGFSDDAAAPRRCWSSKPYPACRRRNGPQSWEAIRDRNRTLRRTLRDSLPRRRQPPFPKPRPSLSIGRPLSDITTPSATRSS